MRGTFDRLVGPVVVATRDPDRSIVTFAAAGRPVLAPAKLERWKVRPGRRPTADLRREVAECVDSDDRGIARSATRFGLCGGGAAVDGDRAARLVRSIREGLGARGDAPLRDPLIVYPEGQDPHVMWKTHVSPEFFTRDRADYVADAIVWCLKVLTDDSDFAEWDRRSAEVAKDWSPNEGIARLHRSAVAVVQRKPKLAGPAWIPVFAYALVRCRTKVKDARVLWHALVGVGPLLLAMAEPMARSGSTDKPAVDVLVTSVDGWRELANEARAWLDVLDELAMFDEDLDWAQRQQDPDEPSTQPIKRTIQQLHDALQRGDVNLQHRVHDLEATDTDGIRNALEEVLAERLAATGIGPGTPFGTLIGVDGAVLLSVASVFGRGVCISCSRRTAPGKLRCVRHQRAVWRQRKREQRSGKSRKRARQRPSRTLRLRRSGKVAPIHNRARALRDLR